MMLAEILASLFPEGHAVTSREGVIEGVGALNSAPVAVLGVCDGTPIGVDQALTLAGRVLDIAAAGKGEPILMLIDSDSQRMSRRDEMLGLSEYLAHLAKALQQAERQGHRTIGLLYGHTAAGAFIATALAADTLVALPGAHPEVMDLASMSRVTKLPLELLQDRAKGTPVFAPGLENLEKTGAIQEVWATDDLHRRLADLLATPATPDRRDIMGQQRGGRLVAAEIATLVEIEALRRG